MTDRDFLFVELGNEISIGLISDGWLHRGAQGVAGNVGHIALGNSKEVCRCGNVGCVELLAGSVAIARAGLLAAQDGRSRYLAEALEASRSIAVADVGFAARLGDPFCAELLSRSGDMIGQALASAINAFNPAVIVLGGEVARTGDIVLAAIREAIYRHSTPVVTRDLRIVRSQMGRSAGLVGAARLAVDALFAPEMLSGWITSGTPLLHPHIDSLA